MLRKSTRHLNKWKTKKNHKPLVVRGARQVGKSHLVREFGKKEFQTYWELNFERSPELADFFKSADPKKCVELLEIHFKTPFVKNQTLLFLDEIQTVPTLLPLLRYFYEELPELHVIATGSMLDFLLSDHDFSMPVGRIEYLHLGPMTFEEFLLAMGENQLLQFVENWNLQTQIPAPIHTSLMNLVKKFCVIGGMPEAILTYVQTQSFAQTEEIKHNILATYQDDFGKYKTRVDHVLLTKVFRKLPLHVAEKIKYVNLDRERTAKEVAHILDLFTMARLIYQVQHSSANGSPLGAQTNDKIFKLLFLDVGLVSSLCGLTLVDFEKVDDLILINQGKISEQYVGQHLLGLTPATQTPELYYWLRENKSSGAEVDYLLTSGQNIVPVEVKSGKSGWLKSMQIFANEKNTKLALRINNQQPQIEELNYKLLSLPFYLLEQIPRLLQEQ